MLDSLWLCCSTVMSCTTAIAASLVKQHLLAVGKQLRQADVYRRANDLEFCLCSHLLQVTLNSDTIAIFISNIPTRSNSLSIPHTDPWPVGLAQSFSASAPTCLPDPEPAQFPGLHGCPLHPSRSRLPAFDVAFPHLPVAASHGQKLNFSPTPSTRTVEVLNTLEATIITITSQI